MNIFIIPSWYPGERDQIAGIFFKEQAIAIGAVCPHNNVSISLWGQMDNILYVGTPLRNIKLLHKIVRRRVPEKNMLLDNVAEHMSFMLTWDDRLFGGNRYGIIKANMQNLRKTIKDIGDVDIIHAHVSYPAGWIAMHLSRQTGIPYVVTEHMGPFPFPIFLRKGRLVREVEEPLKKANAVIAVSPFLADRIQSFGIGRPVVIPNMVDEDFFYPSEKKEHNGMTFFTLAYMAPQKGIPDLLHAVQKAVQQRQDIFFRLGGGGLHLEAFQALAKKLNISKYVQWLGSLSREQVREEFQNCDAFILPSHYETFGVVLAEAIACGKPVIGTRSGGPEFIVNAVNGILVDPGSSEQMGEAILLMAERITNYDSRKIREDFLKRFSKEVVGGQIVGVYKKIIESHQQKK